MWFNNHALTGPVKKRIALFDEDLIYGSIIDKYLRKSRDFVYVGWYKKYHRLALRLKKDMPEVLLLEMPAEAGVSAIRDIKRYFKSICIVVISSNEEDQTIHQAIKSGADGYLIKYLGNQEISDALHNLARGGVALSSPAARSIIKRFWLTTNSPLTRTETKVLKYMSLGHTYASLARSLAISKETVKTHTKNIYRKLNAHRKSEAIERAYSDHLIN